MGDVACGGGVVVGGVACDGVGCATPFVGGVRVGLVVGAGVVLAGCELEGAGVPLALELSPHPTRTDPASPVTISSATMTSAETGAELPRGLWRRELC